MCDPAFSCLGLAYRQDVDPKLGFALVTGMKKNANPYEDIQLLARQRGAIGIVILDDTRDIRLSLDDTRNKDVQDRLRALTEAMAENEPQ